MRNRPTVGVIAGWQVYGEIMDSFLDHVFQGILASADRNELNLMMACGIGQPYLLDFGRPAWPLYSPNVDFVPVGSWNCDGLIFLSPVGTQEKVQYVDRLIEAGYPVVIAGEYPHGAVVSVDNHGGIIQAVDHLVAHGHRKIAFISGRIDDIDGDTPSRFMAYQDGLNRHQLEFNPDLTASGFHTVMGGKIAMQQILDSKIEFTALIGSNDLSTIGAMQVLQSAGKVIPQDVAVIGFDDRIDARAQVPMLTTVHYPMFDLGYQAVNLLNEYFSGTLQGPKRVCIPTRLVIRESCGCAPGSAVRSQPNSDCGRAVTLDLTSTLDLSPQVITVKPEEVSSTFQAKQEAIIDAVIGDVNSESYQLGSQEIEHLCRRLIASLISSLQTGDPQEFALTFQQILVHASAQKDDLLSWHKVVSTIRRWLPGLYADSSPNLSIQQAEEMLNQAIFSITEISQGQNARQVVLLEELSNQVGTMSASFFASQSEEEIFDELLKRLPAIGIAHASVIYYIPEGKDQFAWGEVRASPQGVEQDPDRRCFRIQQFPIAGLYSAAEPFSLALLPITMPGVSSGFVAFDTGNLQLCASIARQLMAALRSVHLYQEAVVARQAAEEAARVKNRFLSWVIHELRTPLNLIYGLSDMLIHESRQAGSDKILVDREDIERIHLGSEHLISLIRDVLDLALSELGQLKLTLEPLDIEQELQSIAVIGKQLALEKGLVWKVDFKDGLPLVKGDKTRIRQVLLNLINNAVKFTASGEVILGASADADKVLITISDTGLGIPKDEQDIIFQEFQQSERTALRGFGGLGLGLAICKRLIAMHGGEIGVHSSGKEGKGSRFYFSLPVYDIQPGHLPSPSLTRSGRKMLLLVNDLEDGRDLAAYLAQEAYSVETYLVQDETDWFSYILLDLPQAVVLDLGLASQKGWDILKMLKANPVTQNLPVLFCSLQEGQSGALLEMDYITKPVGVADLNRALLSKGIMISKDHHHKQILIVDDDPDILSLHSRIVQSQFPNCKILLAQNGRQALEVMRSNQVDLVLLDLLMPEVDGFTVLQTMHQEDQLRHVPVIVLTGQSLNADELERLNNGVLSVLSKGMYSVNETMQHISEAIARRGKVDSEMQRLIFKALSYIHANYPAQITRKDVADFVGLSERHLTRCFKYELGLTPMTYLNRYRILQSRTLLETGRGNIAEIAEKVGFTSGGYFTRVFRQEVGVSPRDYQQGKRQ